MSDRLSGFSETVERIRREERERIIAVLAREMDAMRASRSPSDWEQSYGVEIAIGLIDGGNE